MDTKTEVIASIKRSKSTGRYFLRIDEPITTVWQPIKFRVRSKDDIIKIEGFFCNGMKFDQHQESKFGFLVFYTPDRSNVFMLNPINKTARVLETVKEK
jgi:hypothetical protein